MNRFPSEVLKNIGLFLNQVNQKTCTLVCQAWRQPFQTLVFQKAVLLTKEQLESYNSQDPSLKRLTQSLHFNVSLTDQLFKDFARASPNVHTLTLFVNLLNNLSIPKTVSVISTYWLNSLTKIRMDELLLPKVLPLLSHQLQDVTGSFDCFYTEDRQCLIPMPKLKEADIEGDGGMDETCFLTAKVLDDMRIAYPQLKKLTVSYFTIQSVDEEHYNYTTFPLVRSFHILNCYDESNDFSQIRRMFTDLKEFSFLRTNTEENTERERHYLEVITRNPNIRNLKIDYLYGRCYIPANIFATVSRLKRLTSLHLEIPCETDIISKRIHIDLSILLSILKHLKKLKIWGLCHIETGETSEEYLCGTVGYYDLEEGGNQVDNAEWMQETYAGVTYQSEIFEDQPLFGNGEQLMKNGACVMTVKKRMPVLDDNGVNLLWKVDPMLGSDIRFNDSTGVKTYGLTSLYLEMATIRNPSFTWLTDHCLLLEELHILQSEPYPLAFISLGDRLHTFSLSYDRRYDRLNPPIVRLTDGDYCQKNLEWIPEDKVYKETEKANHVQGVSNAYKVDISYQPMLQELTICGHTVSIV